MLAKAANFVEAAKALGFKETDIDLGVVQKSAMIDKKIAEALKKYGPEIRTHKIY